MTTTAPHAPAGTPERSRGARWRAVGSWTSLALLAALVVLMWPTSWGGGTTLTIVSGHSMEPTFSTGDLLVSRRGPAQVGDVIVYRPPGIDGHVVHRIIGGNAQDGWILRGDNNTWDDIWTPTSQDVVGVVQGHLPRFGAVVQALTSPAAWIAYAVAAIGWLVWPERDEDEAEQDEAEHDEAEHDETDRTERPDGGQDADTRHEHDEEDAHDYAHA